METGLETRMEIEKDNWYLGPKWMPVWIRKRLPFAIEFKGAARIHDWMYLKGGNDRKRMLADVMFYKMMCGRLQSFSNKTIFVGGVWALIYYSLVRIGGALSFQYKRGYR